MVEYNVPTDIAMKAIAPDSLIAEVHSGYIAVGAIHEDKGYLAHFDQFNDKEVLGVMLSELEKEAGHDKENIKIYVAGGDKGQNSDDEEFYEGESGDPFYNAKSIDKFRQDTLDTIAQRGFETNIKEVKWANFNDLQTLKLNLQEGRVIYTQEHLGFMD